MFYVPGSAPDVNTDLPSGFSAAMIRRGYFGVFEVRVRVGGMQGGGGGEVGGGVV